MHKEGRGGWQEDLRTGAKLEGDEIMLAWTSQRENGEAGEQGEGEVER